MSESPKYKGDKEIGTMNKKELNILLRGVRIPETLINQQWFTNPRHKNKEWCNYKWYNVERSHGEQIYGYIIEVPSEYRRDDNVSLILHFYTNNDHVIEKVNAFA